MNIQQQREVEQHVYRFWYALDRRDYSKLLDCVTQRCRWLRGTLIEGHAAILAALESRPTNLTTRHLISNVRVDADAGGMTARYILTTYMHMAAENESPPYACSPPGLIADITMRCVYLDTRLLIDLIEPEILFRSMGH
jgi:hypothetical protein